MADEAPKVKIAITAEDTGVASAIKALGDQLKELKTQSKDTKSELADLSGVFDKLIASAVVLKVVEFGKEVFNASVNVERMAQKTGLSAGTLSTFAKAAESSGVSSEQMNVSLGRLATNITKFEEGSSKASIAFKTLNLTQADFKGLSSDEKVRLVTDRLGAMENGLQKAAIAQQLMGRGGQALLPTLNALAGEGFDKVTEAAKRSGQYLTDEMAADAASAAASFAELEGAGKGIATQFEAGLLPALTDVADALTNQVEDNGVSAFKSLGEEAGTVVKTVVLAWQIGANTIGAILLTLYDVVSGQFRILGAAVESLGEAAIDASRGHFADAGKAIASGFHVGVNIAKNEVDDLQSRWTALADVVTKGSVALFPDDASAAARQKAREARFKKGDGSGDDPTDPDTKGNKARLSLAEAALQNELALYKATNAEEESENQISYDRGLESLRNYFAKRKVLAQGEASEHISVLSRQRTAVVATPTDGSDEAELAKKQKIAKLDNDIAVAKVTAATKQNELDAKEEQATLSLKEKQLAFEQQLAAAQGRTFDAGEAHIEIELAKARLFLAQAGESTAQIDQKLASYRSALEQQKAFGDLDKTGKADIAKLDSQKESITLDNSALIAKQKILQAERDELPQLQKIATQMRASAVGPEQTKAAADFSRQVDQIAVGVQKATLNMKQFGNDAGKAIGQDLTTFLGSTITQVHGIGNAFAQLGNSVVGSIQRIVAQLLVQIATEKLLKAITSSQDDGSGGGGSGGGLGSLLGVLGLADGGLVSGPGSATSDSIPARLSDGEFVVQARAVQAIGIDTLSAINRGVRIPSITGLSIPRFAEGGLVQAGGGHGGGGMDLRLGLSLDEGLVLKHLSSKAASKVILQHIANNPKAANKALSRGQ